MMLLLKRGIRRGLLTLRRERGWGTSLSALLGVVLLVQFFVAACFAVQGADRLLRAQAELDFQIRRGTTDREVQEFLIAVQQQPSVAKAAVVTREQAYERERIANPALVEFLERSAAPNPFSDTVVVTLYSSSAYGSLLAFAQQPQWQNIVDPASLSSAAAEERSLLRNLGMTDTGRTVILLFLGLSGIILLFVVMELVRRRALLRREELFVERMSGAHEASMVVPFATEAAVLLMAALAFSAVLCALVFAALPFINMNEGLRSFAGEVGGRMTAYGPALFFLECLLVLPLAYAAGYLATRTR